VYRLAVEQCERALAAYRTADDHNGLAATLDSLEYRVHGPRRHERAIQCYHEALDLLSQLGDRVNEAGTLTHLGDAHAGAGATAAAWDAWRRALAIQVELGLAEVAQVRVGWHVDAAEGGSGSLDPMHQEQFSVTSLVGCCADR